MRTLYHLTLSPFSRKVRLVLAEKRLAFDLRSEKVWERRAEYLELNPAGTVPRGWARTAPFDPSTPLHGSYVRLALEIPLATMPPGPSEYRGSGVRLRAVDGKVVGDLDDSVRSPRVQLGPEGGARSQRLAEAVAFFIPEHVPDPSRRPAGEELWAEVTIPAPVRLGLSDSA